MERPGGRPSGPGGRGATGGGGGDGPRAGGREGRGEARERRCGPHGAVARRTSVSGGPSAAGRAPSATVVASGGVATVAEGTVPRAVPLDAGVLSFLEGLLETSRSPRLDRLPPLPGGVAPHRGVGSCAPSRAAGRRRPGYVGGHAAAAAARARLHARATFEMTDLLLAAFDNQVSGLNPLGGA